MQSMRVKRYLGNSLHSQERQTVFYMPFLQVQICLIKYLIKYIICIIWYHSIAILISLTSQQNSTQTSSNMSKNSVKHFQYVWYISYSGKYIQVYWAVLFYKNLEIFFLSHISISITNLYIGENDGVGKYCFGLYVINYSQVFQEIHMVTFQVVEN